ncbi:hypothetical protein BX616_000270, partial [Lobosporangium transversale]
NPAHLPVYSARYAPSRALCYYHMFLEHPILMKKLEQTPSTILCIGSGAGSELVGIAAAMVHATPSSKIKKSTKKNTTDPEKKKKKKKDDKKEKKKEQEEKKEEEEQVGEAEAEAAEEEGSKSTAATVVAEVAVESKLSTAEGKEGSSSINGSGSNSEVALEDGLKRMGLATETTDQNSIATGSELTNSVPSATTITTTTPTTPTTVNSVKASKANRHQVTVVMQDYVDWSPILEPMENVIRARMQLGPERLQCETEIGNVLDLSDGLLARVAKADLITFMFVLNELFQDKKRTMLLVARIVAAMPKGAHMLVVDSAGSFSNLQVGGRTYMVYMLLDHLKDLEVVYQDDATWYRCPPSVTYPLKLENMRHFIRIYKKL